ncbi:Carcinine transporter [Nymphon striatum]|nr:Carcinine transporter [Nymphon striatum]
MLRLRMYYSLTEDVIDQARQLFIAVYSSSSNELSQFDSLAELRAHKFLKSNATDLKRLPSTEDAFLLHLERSAYACIIDKTAHIANPVIPEPTEYGWISEGDNMIPHHIKCEILHGQRMLQKQQTAHARKGAREAVAVPRHLDAATLTAFVEINLKSNVHRLIPESVRWLLSQKRFTEAEAILRKIAKTNGKEIPDNVIQAMKDTKQKTEQPNISELFKTPNMRKKTLVIMICWPINAVVYTVLSFQASALGVNEYLGFAISVEIPSYICIWYVMDTIGRRWSVFITMLLGGVSCIITMFLATTEFPDRTTNQADFSEPQTQNKSALQDAMVWEITILAMVGKCCIAASFSVMYVFAGELNPTTIRSTAIGVYASASGIALIAAPYLMYLSKFGKNIPYLVCGILSVVGAVTIIFLPETLYAPLPQTIIEGENFGKNFKILSFPKNRRRIRSMSMRRFSAIRGNPETVTEEMEKKEKEQILNGGTGLQMLSTV